MESIALAREQLENEQLEIEDPCSFIDYRYPSTDSVVLRYHALSSVGLTLADLEESSIREGVRIVPFTTYRNVHIDILDAVTLTATRTFKSIDACIVSALAKKGGIKKCAVASGGNTGYARALYAQRLGIETFWFFPAENDALVPAAARNNPLIHLFPVQDPGQVKSDCLEFLAANPDILFIPTEWKVASFETLGGFIAEQMIDGGSFDWIAQTVSAGFAPLAYCGVLKKLHASGLFPVLPRFLGIQQKENCHMYKAWKNNKAQEPIASTQDLLLPVIFDTEPQTYNTQNQFFDLLDDHRGDLKTISREEFACFEESFKKNEDLVHSIARHDIQVLGRDGKIVERAGFVALAGVIKSIHEGTITPGSRVLSILSGS